MKKENAFQAQLIKKLMAWDTVKKIVKNDSSYIQGFPDLTVYLTNGRWALLECKRYSEARRQANQEYYIEDMGKCGFARFIYPENEEDVLNELRQYASGTGR